MNIKKILTAAAAALTLGFAAAPSAADAAVIRIGFGHGYGYHRSYERRVVEDRVIFETMRFHRIRYEGRPFYMRGHYVVRSHDRFGRVTFVEFDPYTGHFVGFVRL